MNLISISGEKFCSFKEPFNFSFCREPGLYLIQGNNLAQPSLGGNGVGKSTIWDALFWCLTGTTTRGLKNTDVKPWGTTGGTKVSLMVALDDDLLTVTRQTNPNELWLESDKYQTDQEATTEEILDMLGMDAEQLLHGLIISQFGQFFLDMKPSPKQEMFSSLLKLDVWLERSKIASTMVKTIKTGLKDAEQDYAAVEAAIDQLETDDFTALSEEWEENHAADLQEHYDRLAKLEADISKDEWDRIDKDIGFYENLLIEVEGILKDVTEEAAALNQELSDTKHDLRDVDDRIEDALSELAVTLRSGDCHYCGNSVSERAKKDLEDRTRKSVDEWEDRIDALLSDKRDITEELCPIESYRKDQEQERDGLRDKLASLDAEKRDLARIQDRSRQALRANARSIRALEQARNPFAGLRDKTEANRLELGAKLVKLDQAISNLNTALDRTSFWVKGFKELRLYLMDEYLNDLEIEVSNAVKELGLDDWRIEFETSRETTRGTTKHGFEVLVFSPNNKKPVKWECWSGGESSRLKLAGELGIMSMVLSATGSDTNVEVFDEPTSYMSQEGIEDLLDLLKLRAIENQKQIYIIDHHSLNFGGFERIITVERDEHTSRIVE